MKILTIILISLVLVIPLVSALSGINIGTPIGFNVIAENAPQIYVEEKGTYGRFGMGSIMNRSFLYEGEQIMADVFVLDLNGIETIENVYVTVNFGIEASCTYILSRTDLPAELTEYTIFDPSIMGWWDCTFTAETPLAMQGPSEVHIEVMDLDGLSAAYKLGDYDLNPLEVPQKIYLGNGGIYDISGNPVDRMNLVNGEKISVEAFVLYTSSISDLYITVDGTKKVSCMPSSKNDIPSEIDEYSSFYTWMMQWYDCNLTVDSSLQGLSRLGIEMMSLSGTITKAEEENFFDFNPGNDTLRLFIDNNNLEIYDFLLHNPITDREGSYLFEGEKLKVEVLGLETRGRTKVTDAYVAVNGIRRATCQYNKNKKVLPEILYGRYPSFDSSIMAWGTCELTVDMDDYGPSVISYNLVNQYNETASVELNWFLNPIIGLTINNPDGFNLYPVPGKRIHSGDILIESAVDQGSGVDIDVYIAGTDFYDSIPGNSKCPVTNQLSLTNFKYFGIDKFGYSTINDPRADLEGYVPINYGNSIYSSGEIICIDRGNGINDCEYDLYKNQYSKGNFLNEGESIRTVFSLDTPVPCSGQYTTGNIFFFAEAI